jgi:hypothetical protein
MRSFMPGNGRHRITDSINPWLYGPLHALTTAVSICCSRLGNDRVRTAGDVWTELKAMIAGDVAAIGVTPAQPDALIIGGF